MASTNFKLFDENKTNMMSDTEYNINTQRLNGVQAGIASSQLQNKTLHQTSLVAYSLAQIMMQNGYDANDSAAVSAFVGNMSNSLLQKVLDKATSAEAQAGTVTSKWISPATMKAAALLLSGGTMSGPINMGNNKITNLADPTDSLDSANKKYVDENSMFKKIKVFSNKSIVTTSSGTTKSISYTFPTNFSNDQIKRIVGAIFEFKNFASGDTINLDFYQAKTTIVGSDNDLRSYQAVSIFFSSCLQNRNGITFTAMNSSNGCLEVNFKEVDMSYVNIWCRKIIRSGTLDLSFIYVP